MGTLINKLLINKVDCNMLILFGLILGSASSIMLVLVEYKSIYMVAITIALINLGSGFIFANIMAANMAKFSNSGGVFSALQGSLMIVVGFAIASLSLTLNQPTVSIIGIIYFLISFAQFFLFMKIKYVKNLQQIVA